MTYRINLVRDAAPMLDALMHDVVEEMTGHVWNQVDIKLSAATLSVDITPPAGYRREVFDLAVEVFRRGAGWHYSSVLAPTDEDPERPVVTMKFRHPSTNTRLGEPRPARPRAMGFEIPMPDPSLPITPDLVRWYAAQAAAIVENLLTQQCVNETGRTPDQGGSWPRPVVKVQTLAERQRDE